MTATMDDWLRVKPQLIAPFSADEVQWRIGATNSDKSKGLALGYIDARSVMDRLDNVLGSQNWQNRYSHAGDKTICEIGIRIDGEWVWKADGAGDSQTEAEKGALSDAFKRAAVRWGIGRYLYDLPSHWVAIEQRGKSSVIPPAELAKLARSIGAPTTAAPSPPIEDEPTESEKRIYARVIAEIVNINSVEELGRWRKRPESVEAFKDLPAPLRDNVVAAMTKRRDQLSSIVMAG